jgi:hypothetical protein
MFSFSSVSSVHFFSNFSSMSLTFSFCCSLSSCSSKPFLISFGTPFAGTWSFNFSAFSHPTFLFLIFFVGGGIIDSTSQI